MNKCHFLGKVLGVEFREPYEEDSYCIMFTLEVEEVRKSSSGKKIKEHNYLDMEAWDSAACALNQYVEEGSEIAVEAIARGDGEATWFRITNFKILTKGIK